MNCVWQSGAQCLKIMKALHHTNKMINVTFDTYGVHVISMDMSKTSLVKLELEAAEFKSYKCDQTLVLGLYSEVLLNILQKVKKNSLVWSATSEEAQQGCREEEGRRSVTGGDQVSEQGQDARHPVRHQGYKVGRRQQEKEDPAHQ